MIRWPCWITIQSGRSDAKPACTFLTITATNILWISLQPVSIPNEFETTVSTAFRSPFSAPRKMKGGGTLLSSAGSALKSHLKRSQPSVVTEWRIAYGASESFRQTHQIPPMRAPHSTTKAVRVNMRTAGECSIRAASQQNFLGYKPPGSIPKKSRNTLV